MRLKITAIAFVAGLALAACETPADQASDTTGSGAATGGTAADPTPRAVGLDPNEAGGTKEDFVQVGDRVFFGFDRYDLTDNARSVLERQSEWLRRFPNVNVTIAGHADERGTREYNLALGERRANSVKNYLVALGVDPNRIRTISYGKERPVDPRSNEEAWAKNRRGVTELDPTTLGSN